MPNYVYAGITLDKVSADQKKILKKIEEKGSFCNYYITMPEELRNVVIGKTIINGKEYKLYRQVDGKDIPISEREKKMLLAVYGATNWYDFRMNAFDTKWGDCELEIDIDGGQLNYNTAWSPVGDKILNMFAEDFPNFNYWYEEETGWGGERDYEKGKVVRDMFYEEPEWDETEYEIGDSVYTITELEHDHPNYEDGKGFYVDYSHEFAGKTLEEAKKYVDEQHKEWMKTRGKSFEELIK
jgi:hypothetical protein